MPLQNRVTPFGKIIAVSARGLFMGNRGCLHNSRRELVRTHTKSLAWITCQLEFKGRKRVPMTRGQYTELFFLDEATALAAGHRPCHECRRSDLERFRTAWPFPQDLLAKGRRPLVGDLDQQLHRDRLNDEGTQRTFSAPFAALPDGVLVQRQGHEGAWLLWKGDLHHWTASGYDARTTFDPGEPVTVLTPRSTVEALTRGYSPIVHGSAESRQPGFSVG